MATITSTTSGNFSAGATWAGGVAPAEGDSAVIANTHTVTLDATVTVGADSGNAILIQSGGILTVSGNIGADRTLTCKGSLYIEAGGECYFGTTASPISGGTLTIKLNYSATLAVAKYRSYNYGKLVMQGSAKKSITTLTSAITGGATSEFTVTDATGWAVGDTIMVMTTADADQTETATISGVAGNTITVSGAFTNSHAISVAVGTSKSILTPVANLTRSVVVTPYSTSHGTNYNTYNATEANFDADFVNFSYLSNGTYLLSTAKGTINDCVYSNCTYAINYGSTGYSTHDRVTYNNNIFKQNTTNDIYYSSTSGGLVHNNYLHYKCSGDFIKNESEIDIIKLTNSYFYEGQAGKYFININAILYNLEIDNCKFYRAGYRALYIWQTLQANIKNSNFYENALVFYAYTSCKIQLENNTYDGNTTTFDTIFYFYLEDVNSEYGQQVAEGTIFSLYSQPRIIDMKLRNCKGTLTIPSLLAARGPVKIQTEDQAGNYVTAYPQGKIEKSTDGADDIALITLTDATYLPADLNVPLERKAPVDNGDTITVTVDIEISAAYDGTAPVMTLYGCGVTEDTDTHSGATGSYDTLSVSGTASRAGEVIILLEFNGTAGTAKVKNYTVTYS